MLSWVSRALEGVFIGSGGLPLSWSTCLESESLVMGKCVQKVINY